MSNWLQTLVMGIAKIHILQISFFLPYETLFYDRTRTKTSQKRPCGWNPAFFGENHLNGGPPWTSPRTRWRGWRKEEAEDLTKPEYWYVQSCTAAVVCQSFCPLRLPVPNRKNNKCWCLWWVHRRYGTLREVCKSLIIQNTDMWILDVFITNVLIQCDFPADGYLRVHSTVNWLLCFKIETNPDSRICFSKKSRFSKCSNSSVFQSWVLRF